MIARLIYGFIALLIGTSLIGPIATLVNTTAVTNGALYNSSTWGASILSMVPGFYAIALLCVAIAMCMGALRDAGIA